MICDIKNIGDAHHITNSHYHIATIALPKESIPQVFKT